MHHRPGNRRVDGQIWQPTNVDEIQEALAFASKHNQTIIPRGVKPRSDDIVHNQVLTIDLSHMNRLQILQAEPNLGIARVEPGVTIGELCRRALAEGFWPEVIPSTAEATLGGSLSLNVSGTNAHKKGSIGYHVESFELLLASGDLVTVSLHEPRDLYYTAIGGLGMLGIITGIRLRLRRVLSGMLLTRQLPANTLSEMFSIFAEERPNSDYLEGWIDSYAAGDNLGRGIVLSARFLEEPEPLSLHLRPGNHIINIAKILPSIGQSFHTLLPESGARMISTIRYNAYKRNHSKDTKMPMTTFHFHPPIAPLFILSPLRTRSFQIFVPRHSALTVFSELLKLSQQRTCIPFRCFLRYDCADEFLLSYHVEGFSLELVYCVRLDQDARLQELLTEMCGLVINNDGRLLPTDELLDPQSYRRSMGEECIANFLPIKQKYLPDKFFQFDLSRRLFGEV